MNSFAVLKARVERRAAPALLALVTFRARRRLQRNGVVHILMDTSALASAVLHESIWVSTGHRPWGDATVDTGYQARIPVHQRPASGAPRHARRDFEDACYMVGIAHLARLGLIKLHTSAELQMERWQKPTGMVAGYSMFSHTVLDGIPVTSVDGMPAVEFGPKGMKLPTLKELQCERLTQSQDAMYLALRRRLGDKSSQDAWHVRTAEVHDMYCLLTTDYALMRQLEAQGKHEPICSLRTKVMSPTQLGKELGLLPLNPRHICYEGADFPVRPDLHLPGGKRRVKR